MAPGHTQALYNDFETHMAFIVKQFFWLFALTASVCKTVPELHFSTFF